MAAENIDLNNINTEAVMLCFYTSPLIVHPAESTLDDRAILSCCFHKFYLHSKYKINRNMLTFFRNSSNISVRNHKMKRPLSRHNKTEMTIL